MPIEGQSSTPIDTTITLKAGTTSSAATFIGKHITIESGTGAGQSRTITAFNTSTKVATVDRSWVTNPDSTSVYRIPFTFKGDVLKVREVSGNTIWIYDTLSEGYDVNLETVSVEIRRPVSPLLKNIRIERSGSTSGGDEYCVRIRGADRAQIIGVATKGGWHSGFSVTNAYKPLVQNCSAFDILSPSTGYGCSFFGGNSPKVEGWVSVNCRRAVDFTGNIPAKFGVLDGFDINCGGRDGNGDRREPNGTSSSTGFGSHGGALGCTYRNGTVLYGSSGAALRGIDDLIQNVRFFGQSASPIRSVFGGTLTIEDCTYSSFNDQGTVFGGANTTVEDSTSNARIRQANYFVELWSQRIRGAVTIRNCRAANLSRSFVGLQATSAGDEIWYDLDISGNRIYYDPNVAGTHPLIDSTDSATHTIASATLSDNSAFARQGPVLATFGSLVTAGSVSLGLSVANMIGESRTYAIQIPDDAVAFMPAPFGQTQRLRFSLFASDSTVYRADAVITKNSATLTTFGALASVEGFATGLSGTNGNDAVVSVHFNGQALHVENRSGASRLFFITIYPAL